MRTRLLTAALIASAIMPLSAQTKNTAPQQAKSAEGYLFTPVVDLKATPVKNQAATSTCWCFATSSFIESELLRMGKGEYDLSEMYIVRENYIDRLKDNYLRQGNGNIGEGGNSHDFFSVFSEKGIVPDEVYTGLNYGSPAHNHSEMQLFLLAVAGVPLERKQQSSEYFQIVDAVLDIYLGEVPESFTWKGQSYTAKSFAASLGINPSDYIEITSFTHFPFYTRGILEIPDNWRMAGFYNVPLDELIEIIDYSLNSGYTVNWDGDVSETGFSHTNGYAIMAGPAAEINVTQDLRQSGYESFTTTDDHGMHLTGIVKDQNGTKYYKTKNSWGTDRNAFGGYLNMSENYVKAKTLFIMVHKNAIPPEIKTKLGI